MGTTNLDLDHIDRKVQFMIIHPKYDPKGNWGSYDSDLALLKFEEPVKFKPNVIPICLPDDDNEDFAGQIGWTTGWGQLHEKGKEFICISTKTIHYSANLKKKKNHQFSIIYFVSSSLKSDMKDVLAWIGLNLLPWFPAKMSMSIFMQSSVHNFLPK